MKSILFLLALSVLVLVPAARAQDAAPAVDPAKTEEIRKLMEISGVVKTTDMMVDQMFTQLRNTNTQVPADTWDRLREKLDTKSLVDQTLGLYAKYYSLDDLKAVNAFYASPAGQHMLAVQPKLMQESIQLSMKWAQDITKSLAQEMAEKKPSKAPDGN